MPENLRLTLLDHVRIASPCPARWEDMTGDDKVRHCARCNLSVHNLSAMPHDEAESLLASRFDPDGSQTDGRFCASFFRRADGTILTRDCPVGLAAVRARLRRTLSRVATALGLITGAGAVLGWALREDSYISRRGLRNSEPFATLTRWITPRAPAQFMGVIVRGDIGIAPRAARVTPLPAPIPQQAVNPQRRNP